MKSYLPVLFFILLIPAVGHAQNDDTDRLTPSFHAARRKALIDLLPERSAAIFFANPVRNRSNDVDYQYHQDPNLYYLSGYREPNSLLILFKDERELDGVKTREVFFVQSRNPSQEQWTGPRLGVEGVKRELGFSVVYNADDWKDFGINWDKLNEILVLYPELPNSDKYEKADLGDLVAWTREKLDPYKKKTDLNSLHGLTGRLRETKLPDEIVLLQKAIDITVKGFHELATRLEPGMREYQAQAIVEYHAKHEGCAYMGYPSICGGGPNSCILHYTNNRRRLKGNEMFLADMGAEYHGYTADITRTFPIDGHFSTEELAIYNLVLAAQDSGITACKAGRGFRASHAAAQRVIEKGLIQLGIIKKESDASSYFMHGTSHYLGLDVHDAGTYGPLKAGTVMTVEPGIYIREGADCDPKWWNIGVRIEDDILVTEGDPVVLSSALPRKAAEIEKMMSETFD